MPAAREGIACALFKKPVPLLMPCCEGCTETSLLCNAQSPHYVSEFSTGIQLWISREIPGDDGYLVELAHLHGNARKERLQALFSVSHHCQQRITHPLQCIPRSLICVDGFVCNLRPIDVPLSVRIAHHYITRCAPKKHAVHNHYYRAGL